MIYFQDYIGIGTPITERPSHTTGRTGHVRGGPRFVEATAGQVRLGKTDTDNTWSAGPKKQDDTGIFPPAAGLHDADKYVLFDSHDHLPKLFGWGPFRPSPVADPVVGG